MVEYILGAGLLGLAGYAGYLSRRMGQLQLELDRLSHEMTSLRAQQQAPPNAAPIEGPHASKIPPAFANDGRSPMALTKTEIPVLVLLGTGMSNKEIAAKMVCSVKTIKNHLNAIFQKLEVSNRTEAVVKGIKMGLISPKDPNSEDEV